MSSSITCKICGETFNSVESIREHEKQEKERYRKERKMNRAQEFPE